MSGSNGGPNWQHSRSRRPHLFVKMEQISVVAYSVPIVDDSVQGAGAGTCSLQAACVG